MEHIHYFDISDNYYSVFVKIQYLNIIFNLWNVLMVEKTFRGPLRVIVNIKTETITFNNSEAVCNFYKNIYIENSLL